MRILLILGALIAAALMAGCVSFTAVKGQQGKAFVVKASPFGSTIWNCEAGGGKPKCYQVLKQ